MKTKPAIPHPLLLGLAGLALLLGCTLAWVMGGDAGMAPPPAAATEAAPSTQRPAAGRDQIAAADQRSNPPGEASRPTTADQAHSNIDIDSARPGAQTSANASPSAAVRSGAESPSNAAVRGGVNVLGQPALSSHEGPFEPSPPSSPSDLVAVLKSAPEILTSEEMALVEAHKAETQKNAKELLSQQKDRESVSRAESAEGQNLYRRLRELLGRPDLREAQLERDLLAAKIGSDAVQAYETTAAMETKPEPRNAP